MKNYDVFLFDFDGTIFDTKESLHKVFRDGFEAVGLTCTDAQAEHYMHQNLLQTAEEAGVKKEDYAAFGEAIGASIDDPATIAKNIPFPETEEVLRVLLKQGKRIGIVSGNTVKHIRLVWEYWHLPEYSEEFMGSDIYKHGKPSPEPLLFALRDMGVEPSDKVLYVGDSLQDVEAADAAGVDSVLIDREGEYPEFTRWKIASLKELI